MLVYISCWHWTKTNIKHPPLLRLFFAVSFSVTQELFNTMTPCFQRIILWDAWETLLLSASMWSGSMTFKDHTALLKIKAEGLMRCDGDTLWVWWKTSPQTFSHSEEVRCWELFSFLYETLTHHVMLDVSFFLGKVKVVYLLCMCCHTPDEIFKITTDILRWACLKAPGSCKNYLAFKSPQLLFSYSVLWNVKIMYS